MSTRASGAGRKKNVVQISNKQIKPIQTPSELLSSVAEDMWNKQAKILSESGRVDPVHHPILILYCNAWHYIVQADESLTKKASSIGSSYVLASEGGSGGEKGHPVFTARNIAFNQFVRAGSLLELDPLSSLRSPLKTKEATYNPFLHL